LDFRVNAASCRMGLPPGGTCAMSVSFRPRMVGSRHCTVHLRATDGSTASVTLTGRGVRR
jgi:hypothetical protein